MDMLRFRCDDTSFIELHSVTLRISLSPPPPINFNKRYSYDINKCPNCEKKKSLKPALCEYIEAFKTLLA